MKRQTSGSGGTSLKAPSTIKQLADEHPGLKQELQTRIQPFIEAETLLRLQGLECTWAVASQDQLIAGQERTEALLEFLGTTLMSHCMKAERVLGPALSRTLRRALVTEHAEMGTTLGRIKEGITDAWEKPGSPEEFASSQKRVQFMVKEMNNMVQDHMAQESAIFSLAIKALEKEQDR